MCWMGIVGGPGAAMTWPIVAAWIVMKVLVWATVVTLIVWGIRRWRSEGCLRTRMTPLEILKSRYARGELSRQDFETMRQDVER